MPEEIAMDCRALRVTFSLLLSAVFAFAQATSSGKLVCPVNIQRELTDDRILLPLESISSSSEDITNPASNFVMPSSNWCSAKDTPVASEEYVSMNFTEPIVVTMLVSGGLTSSYVMNFSIYHTISLTKEDFQPYGVLKPVQEFAVPSILLSDMYFALEMPLKAKRLKFHINEGLIDPFSRICWSMLVYGCKASEARTVEEVVAETMATPTTSNIVTDDGTSTRPTSKSIEQPSPISCLNQDGFVQKDLLLIVIPSAAILIIIFLIIITVGVIICLCYVKSPQTDSPTYETVKLKIGNKRTKEIVENGTTTPGSVGFLYDQPRPQFYDVPKSSIRSHGSVRGSTSTIGSHMEIKNPVYLAKKNLQEMTDALHQLPSDDGNDYEDVLDSPPLKPGMDRQTQSNAAYSCSFYRPPIPTSDFPNNDNMRPPFAVPIAVGRAMSLDNGTVPKYSKVNKEKRMEGDGGELERGKSSSPVIKSHYMSTNAAITEELNRLTTELENSLKGQS